MKGQIHIYNYISLEMEKNDVNLEIAPWTAPEVFQTGIIDDKGFIILFYFFIIINTYYF